MNNRMFRQKSLDQMSSVEEPRDYLRTVGPRLWMLVSAVVLLVVGLAVYVRTATMENTADTIADVAMVEDAEGNSGLLIAMQIPSNVVKAVHSGTRVVVAGQPGELYSIYTDADGRSSGYVMLDDPGLREDGTAVLSDGTYEAKIILESVSPFEFLS